jgi:hypothetical protein
LKSVNFAPSRLKWLLGLALKRRKDGGLCAYGARPKQPVNSAMAEQSGFEPELLFDCCIIPDRRLVGSILKADRW